MSGALVRRPARFLRDLYRYLGFRYRFSDSRGVYASFDEALKAAPAGALHGYDHAALAATYRQQDLDQLAEYEYPLLHHLEKILAAQTMPVTVLDFGGNTGIHFLRLRQRLDFTRVHWIVMDLPAITQVGRELCSHYPNIRFINNLQELDGSVVDVLVAYGSLQYVEDFGQFFLPQLQPPPQHIIAGQLLLHAGATFVTLQNGGSGTYYPQYVFNRDAWLQSMTLAGYAVVDSWRDYSNACSIPFHPERSVACSWGFYFRRA